jgi:LmbE family N-acetylglucosaminyl deacetylase
MTSTLFLAPHNDDESLFGAFTIARERAHVVVVLRSHYQAKRWPGYDCTFQRRELETAAAVAELGASWEQWEGFDDRDPDWNAIGAQLRTLDLDRRNWTTVYAPLPEHGGHDHHNELGVLAAEIWPTQVRFYPTYTRENGRSVAGERVDPQPAEVVAKLRALACYGSQIENWLCRPHFLRPLDEYVVTP